MIKPRTEWNRLVYVLGYLFYFLVLNALIVRALSFTVSNVQ